MTINGKVLSKDSKVHNIVLNSDPSDSEIYRALGGTGDEVGVIQKTIGDWEIHRLPDSNGDMLVIGKAPGNWAAVKARKSCDLSDQQVVDICNHMDG